MHDTSVVDVSLRHRNITFGNLLVGTKYKLYSLKGSKVNTFCITFSAMNVNKIDRNYD